MYWADEIAEKIGNTPQHVDDMKTLSGHPHIGSLRGPILHDVVYKALREKNDKTVFTYVFNDFDVVDGLSPDLMERFKQYFGYPLKTVPSPDESAENFADYFANSFRKVLETLGVEAEYVSSWDMYHAGKFNDAIRIALDNAEKIQDIYKRVSGSDKKAQGWYPLQVICPNCHKLGTTKVTGWDGALVTYSCEKNLVKWAEGCGHTGTMDPFNGNAKLPWKVDWPAHWSVMGVTFEGAGKDHGSAGGSYDIAFELCKEVFKREKPFHFVYEFFLFGGRKMSTSKGTGFKAHEITDVLPPEVARFLLIRTNPKSAIDFDPAGMTIPDLFDEFDRCAEEFWADPQTDLSRAFYFSQVNDWYGETVYLPRFRDVANVLQLKTHDVREYFEKEKGSPLSDNEQHILDQRVAYAQMWITDFAPENARFEVMSDVPSETAQLSDVQKSFLEEAAEIVLQSSDPEQLQIALYEKGKELALSGKQIFQAVYMSLLGKSYGPKAAWFISSLDKEFVAKRFRDVADYQDGSHKKAVARAKSESNVAKIDPEVLQQYPEICFGIAVIKNVSIKKTDLDLEAEKKTVLDHAGSLTTEDISAIKSIQAYRTLFRSFGVDWHSRRPSPEALIRRVALGKELYTVNTLVDAYNLAVLENHIGLGAFDMAHITAPVTLRFADGGEMIHLLGDDEPTTVTQGELVYADQNQVITLDLNYRDADATKVTEKTKDIILFADGAPGISSEEVMQALEKGIEHIVKYCGGDVEKKELIK